MFCPWTSWFIRECALLTIITLCLERFQKLQEKGWITFPPSLWAAASPETMCSEVSAPQSRQLHTLSTTTPTDSSTNYVRLSRVVSLRYSVFLCTKLHLSAQWTPFSSNLHKVKHKDKAHRIQFRQKEVGTNRLYHWERTMVLLNYYHPSAIEASLGLKHHHLLDRKQSIACAEMSVKPWVAALTTALQPV